MKKAPLHPPGRQGSCSANAKLVSKSSLGDFASPRSGTPLLAAPAPAIGSPALVMPFLETAVLPGSSLAGPDSAAPMVASAGKAPAVPARTEAPLRSTKDLTITAPAKADPPLPRVTASCPPKLSTEEPHGELADVPTDVGDEQDQGQRGKEVQNVSVQSPMGQKGKTKCKYRSKGRNPGNLKGSPSVVRQEEGNDGTGEEEGQGDDADSEDDDFQHSSPVNKLAGGVKRYLKVEGAKVVPNAPALEGKKLKKTPVEQRKSTASNTRAARRGSK
jgi:hypothetical protein